MVESGNWLGVGAEEFFNNRGRLVPASEPNDFRRLAVEGGHVMEIGVVVEQNQGAGLGVPLVERVVGLGRAKPADLAEGGKEVGAGVAEFEAGALIEQRLHATVGRRR